MTVDTRFTTLFEAMVIDWLKVASFAAVARQCRLRWDQVAGMQARAGGPAGAVSAPGGRGARWSGWTRRHSNGGIST